MTLLHVCLHPATEQRRLRPYYDAEAGVLSLSGTSAAPWTQGVDIDGTIVIDLDAHGYLCNIDLLVPREHWDVGPLLVPPPESTGGRPAVDGGSYWEKSSSAKTVSDEPHAQQGRYPSWSDSCTWGMGHACRSVLGDHQSVSACRIGSICF